MPGQDGGDSRFRELTAPGGSGGEVRKLFRADDLNADEAVIVGRGY